MTKGFAGYVGMIAAGKNAGVFATGLSEMMAKIGMPTSFGLAYGSVFLTLMALTIMYLVVRFMRVASAEFLGDSVPLFKNTTFGTIVALLLSALSDLHRLLGAHLGALRRRQPVDGLAGPAAGHAVADVQG